MSIESLVAANQHNLNLTARSIASNTSGKKTPATMSSTETAQLSTISSLEARTKAWAENSNALMFYNTERLMTGLKDAQDLAIRGLALAEEANTSQYTDAERNANLHPLLVALMGQIGNLSTSITNNNGDGIADGTAPIPNLTFGPDAANVINGITINIGVAHLNINALATPTAPFAATELDITASGANLTTSIARLTAAVATLGANIGQVRALHTTVSNVGKNLNVELGNLQQKRENITKVDWQGVASAFTEINNALKMTQAAIAGAANVEASNVANSAAILRGS